MGALLCFAATPSPNRDRWSGCAAVVALVYFVTGREIVFNLQACDWLLVYFFAAIGLKSELLHLISGRRPPVVLTVLAGRTSCFWAWEWLLASA